MPKSRRCKVTMNLAACESERRPPSSPQLAVTFQRVAAFCFTCNAYHGSLRLPLVRVLDTFSINCRKFRAMKYWEIIADNFSKSGWSWGCVSVIDSNARTIWIADAHRGEGKPFVVRADEKLTAFLELESAICTSGRLRFSEASIRHLPSAGRHWN